MRRHLGTLAIVLLALTAPAVAGAQQADTIGPWPLGRTPGDVVLQHRTQLSLSAPQLTQIEQIRARLASQNEPLLARLRAAGYPTTAAELRATTVGQMQELRRKAAELRPTIREIAANNQSASREIQNLLTLEQYGRLRDLDRSLARARGAGRGGTLVQGGRFRGGFDLPGLPGRGELRAPIQRERVRSNGLRPAPRPR